MNYREAVDKNIAREGPKVETGTAGQETIDQ